MPGVFFMNQSGEVSALGAYLAEDPAARRYFACLVPERQREIVSETAALADRNEVAAYVSACMEQEQ